MGAGFSSNRMSNIGDIAAGMIPPAAELRARNLQEAQTNNIIFWVSSGRKLIASNHAPEYQVWLALQHVNRRAGGSGWVEVTGAGLRELADLVGLSPHRVRVLLAERSGLAWHKHGRRVRIVSQVKLSVAANRLAAAAGIADPLEPDTHCSMPVKSLAGSLQEVKSLVLDAWLCEQGEGWMGTWAMLGRLWGHSWQTLQTWLDIRGLVKTHNAGLVPMPQFDSLSDADLQALARDPAALGFSHGGVWLQRYGGHVYLGFQRGNTYHGRTARRTSAAGKGIKTNRAIRACAGDLGAQAIWDALRRRPGGLSPRPDSAVGTQAGQLTRTLEEHDPTGGGTSGLLLAWHKLVARGRMFFRKTNYRQAQPYRRACAARRGDDLYLLQRRTRFSRPGYSAWWATWLLRPGAGE